MNKTNDKYIYLMFTAVISLIMIQRFSFDGNYYPVMDDWFLYGDIYENKWVDFIVPNEKFAIRPMAGIADMLFVSPLFTHLWIVELVLTIVLVVGFFLILDVLRKKEFSVGGVSVLLLCLLPMNVEATYWIAAAIRISFSMFFLGISCWALQKYIETDLKRFLIIYFVIGFITVGFYEPVILIYLFLSAYLIWKGNDKKYLYLLAVAAIHIIAIILYYICNGSSLEMESRGQLLTTGIIEHTIKINEMLWEIVTELNVRVFLQGLERGIYLISRENFALQSIVIIISSAILGVLSMLLVQKERKFSYRKFLTGVILGFAGVSVFYILADARFTIRSVYFLFIGIGIMFEELLNIINYHVRCIIIFILVSVFACAFVVAGIGTVDKYQNVSHKDVDIVKQILNLDDEKFVTDSEKNAYLFGAEPYYKDVQTVEYFESIRGACSNYADITGCIRHITGISNTRNLLPVKDGGEIDLSVYVNKPEICALFALDENENVIKVSLTENQNGFDIFDKKGELYGTLKKIENGKFLFERNI